jgi:hypothetical protein
VKKAISYQRCSELFDNARNLHDDVCKSVEMLVLKRMVFCRECRHLLRIVASETEAIEMMAILIILCVRVHRLERNRTSISAMSSIFGYSI